MSFPRKRRERQEADRALEARTGVRRRDETADRFAAGNVYSSADIEELEREKTAFWRRRRKG
jgi:hypothetical protein